MTFSGEEQARQAMERARGAAYFAPERPSSPTTEAAEPMPAAASFGLIVLLALVVVVCFAIGSGTNDNAKVATFIFFPAIIALYFSPAIVAATRRHPSVAAVSILNIVGGWTLLGWVVALVWAYSSSRRPEPAVVVAPDPPAAPPAPDAAMKDCPFCAEPIRAAAIKCKHCGSDLTAADAKTG